jgi:hypothetical protein
MKHIAKVMRDSLKGNKSASLRARGLAPRANFIIRPAAGSLVEDVPSLRDNKERSNAVADRMLASSGARRQISTT